MEVKVCHISTVHPLNDVRILYRQCGSLASYGFEVHLVITAENDDIINGVHIHALKPAKNRFFRMLVSPLAAMKKALQTKAEIIHYHDPELLFVGFVMRWVFGKKVIFDVHEDIPGQIKSKEYLPLPVRGLISRLYSVMEKILLLGQEIIVANQNCLKNSLSRYLIVCQHIQRSVRNDKFFMYFMS